MTPQRLDELIHAHLDGALSPADRAELEQHLLASPEARRRFWDETAWHGRLHEAAQLAWSAPAAAPAAPRRRTGWWLGALGLAAAAALALWLRPAADSVPTGPRVAHVDGAGVVRRAGIEQPAAAGLAVQAGDELQVAEGGALRLALANGTRLDLAGGSRLVVRDADARQLDLRAGRVTADVHPQPAGRQLVLTTPLARATVHGTVFTLAASTAATHLQVQRGMVRMAHAQQDSEVDVAGGEFALAVPGADLVAGLEPVTGRVAAATGAADRDPAARPFAPDSPWNTALGRGAQFEPVRSSAFDFARHGAVVLPAAHDRALFVAGEGDPETEVINRYDGRRLARIRASASALRDARRLASATFLDPIAGVAHELALAGRDGAALAALVYRVVDLRGPGIPPAASGHTFGGFPLLAGVIRAGELERGIPHALAASALHTGLSRGPDGAAHVWPSRHLPLENKLLARLGAEGNVRYGTRLAIPRDVDLATLGVGASGPAFELARAMQDYGVYITHSYAPVAPGSAGGWVQPDLQFFAETDDLPALRALAAQVTKLVAHLQVVANNGPERAGGGDLERGTGSNDPRM